MEINVFEGNANRSTSGQYKLSKKSSTFEMYDRYVRISIESIYTLVLLQTELYLRVSVRMNLITNFHELARCFYFFTKYIPQWLKHDNVWGCD